LLQTGQVASRVVIWLRYNQKLIGGILLDENRSKIPQMLSFSMLVDSDIERSLYVKKYY